MHEASLMSSALALALDHARSAGAARVLRLRLGVGVWSGVAEEALRFAFAAMTPGTPADGAALELTALPVRYACQHCAAEFAPQDGVRACPFCQHTRTRVAQGHDLRLLQLEVD